MLKPGLWVVVVGSVAACGCSSTATNRDVGAGGSQAGGSAGSGAGTAGTGGSQAGGSGGVAGVGATSSGGTGPDTEAPYVVSTSPADGEAGVLEGARIEIQFSEPMDRASVEQALQLGTIPDGTTMWSAAGDLLQYTPGVKLPLAEGDSVETVTASAFQFSVTKAAMDLAGNPLRDPAKVGFTTARRISHYLPLLSTHTGVVTAGGAIETSNLTLGDTAANEQRKAFFSFSIADLPTGIITIEAGRLSANQTQVARAPYAGLGELRVFSVAFPTLNAAAFQVAPREDLGQLSLTGATGPKTFGVRNGLVADYAERSTLGNRSEYRVEFTTATDLDGTPDLATFDANSLRLLATYLVP